MTSQRRTPLPSTLTASLIVAVLGLVFPALVLVFAPSATAAKPRSCGKVTGTKEPPYRVEVFRGAVSCQEARTIIRAYNSGKGKLHKTTEGLETWYTTFPGGWSCVEGAGGAEECFRGPMINRYTHRDIIGGEQLP
jgi:hypothetical protein